MKDLRSIAKRAGVSVRGFRKAEMLTALSDIQPENLTVKILRTMAKKSGVQGFGNRSRVGAVVRALAFHQCGPGSIPGPGVICGLSLLVLYSAPRGFSPGTPVFPSPQKPTFDLI